MIFEIGDIVICTGFDHLSKGYDGQNLLEMCGFDRNHKFEIIEIFFDNIIAIVRAAPMAKGFRVAIIT